MFPLVSCCPASCSADCVSLLDAYSISAESPLDCQLIGFSGELLQKKKKNTKNLEISALGYGYPSSTRLWRRESCAYTTGRMEPISVFLSSFCTQNISAFFSVSIWAPAVCPWEWVWMLWTHHTALDNIGAVSLAAVMHSEAHKWKSWQRKTKWYMCLRDLQFPWQD